MRIVLTGGGTGGHFYPLIAVAENLYEQSETEKLANQSDLYYVAPEPYDKDALSKLDITFRKVTSGKMRTYFSVKNLFSYFQIGMGILKAVWVLFSIYPDVVFAKGGYASLPVLVAARVLRIPVVIHESDSIPGRVNRWAGSFARRIGVSFPQAAEHFPEEKTAVVGNPVRSAIQQPAMSGAREYLDLPQDKPVVFVLGGSQGAETINSVILSGLEELLEDYCIIHQTGQNNLESVQQTEKMLFDNMPRDRQGLADHYKAFGYLETEAMQMAAGAADIVVSRAGSAIFEIAAWTVPAILIPLEIAHADHQRENAYAYARAGGAAVIEEENLSDHILTAEIDNILNNAEKYEQMVAAAADFYRPDSGETIARELIHISKSHKQ
jgi:UDP-N-acetylglucosamine--N-acetylmuramyl-(pentapeptide) pyrophosphoryl-undecaprenol N-acetylglucosamine transferase